MTIGVREASAAVIAGVSPLPPESIDIERALGRVCAEGIAARTTMPPWNAASMDGYAVKGSDRGMAASEPFTYRIVGELQAGSAQGIEIARGEAVRIMTGAPVPATADTVVRLEDTRREADSVVFLAAPNSGGNVRLRGEDFSLGDVVVTAGTEVNAGGIGVLAAAGHATVNVHRAPRVAVISSGDELVDLTNFDRVARAERIVSANNYTLCALVADAGGIPVDLGIAEDNERALAQKLEAAHDCDLILTSAGISVGDHDHTRAAVTAAGGREIFWRVRMRPGAPMAFGMVGAIPWLGLSGNPVSAIVTFELFVRAAIRRMLGHQALFRSAVSAVLEEPVRTPAPLTHFLRGVASQQDESHVAVRLAGSQSSGVLTSMAKANALIIVPENTNELAAGDPVKILMLDAPFRFPGLDL